MKTADRMGWIGRLSPPLQGGNDEFHDVVLMAMDEQRYLKVVVMSHSESVQLAKDLEAHAVNVLLGPA